MSTLTSSKDCQEKSKSVGIYDKKVYSGQSSNEVCGCRAFSHKGNLDALHWNDPKGSCSPATKCTTQSQCVCLKKGIRTIFYTSKYKLTALMKPCYFHLIINVFSSGGPLEEKTPAVGKIDNDFQIDEQIKNDIYLFIYIWQLLFLKILMRFIKQCNAFRINRTTQPLMNGVQKITK